MIVFLIKRALSLFACLIILIDPVWADGCNPDTQDCAEVGELKLSVALGYGMRSNPLINSDDIPIVIIPGVSYYGERLFINTTTAGFSFVEKPEYSLNLISTLSFDQVYFNRWNARNFTFEGGGAPITGGGDGLSGSNGSEDLGVGLEPENPTGQPDGGSSTGESAVSIDLSQLNKRKMTLLSGIEYIFYQEQWALSLQALKDTFSVHDGTEVRAAFSFPLQKGQNLIELSFGTVWQSEKVVDYYYGVSDDEVDYSTLEYQASSEFSQFAKLDWKYVLSEHWQIQLSVHSKWFGSEITDSPIIEKNTSSTVFFGGVYHF